MNSSTTRHARVTTRGKMNQTEVPAAQNNTRQLPAIVTIGVYGFDETTFFQALREAGVDTFCDIRRRRGVRGTRYAFANSRRLQKRLSELGIQYRHLLELAPTAEIRERQKTADSPSSTAASSTSRARDRRKPIFCSPTAAPKTATHFRPNGPPTCASRSLSCGAERPAPPARPRHIPGRRW